MHVKGAQIEKSDKWLGKNSNRSLGFYTVLRDRT